MVEIGLVVVLIVTMVRIANAENQSGVLWGAATFGIAFLCCILIPIPFIRIVIAGVVSYGAMLAYKIAFNK